jgi:hypothetical protein
MRGIQIYFTAFKKHIGLYPPVSGDPEIAAAILPCAGVPYELIEKTG